ncbi:MAG TPA: hypothetical protein PKY50_12600 [Candidatus Competibacter sp.]|nr:hypothetical protein [Candidatus Competibacter sp.]
MELPADEAVRRAAEFGLTDPAKHTLVFYGDCLGPHGGGLSLSAPGGRMAAFEGGGPRRRYRTCALAWDALRPFFHFALPPLNPDPEGGMDGPAVGAGERLLVPNEGSSPFDPRGKLVIYGFGAGGFDAIDLCRRIDRFSSWYNFESGQIGGPPSTLDPFRFAQVRVDLLITVDPCRIAKNLVRRDPAMGGAGTATPIEVVREHANYYQKNDPDHPGISLDVARINRQLYPNPAGAHDCMPIQTLPDIKKLLVNLLQ